MLLQVYVWRVMYVCSKYALKYQINDCYYYCLLSAVHFLIMSLGTCILSRAISSHVHEVHAIDLTPDMLQKGINDILLFCNCIGFI
jgi:hypothetical protein